jgi:predicted nucleotidyltransferase
MSRCEWRHAPVKAKCEYKQQRRADSGFSSGIGFKMNANNPSLQTNLARNEVSNEPSDLDLLVFKENSAQYSHLFGR